MYTAIESLGCWAGVIYRLRPRPASIPIYVPTPLFTVSNFFQDLSAVDSTRTNVPSRAGFEHILEVAECQPMRNICQRSASHHLQPSGWIHLLVGSDPQLLWPFAMISPCGQSWITCRTTCIFLVEKITHELMNPPKTRVYSVSGPTWLNDVLANNKFVSANFQVVSPRICSWH